MNLGTTLPSQWASLVAQMVKNLPAMQETWVGSLGWEDSLGKGMATHSSILAWRIPWTEEPGSLQSRASQRVKHNWVTNIPSQHTEMHFTATNLLLTLSWVYLSKSLAPIVLCFEMHPCWANVYGEVKRGGPEVLLHKQKKINEISKWLFHYLLQNLGQVTKISIFSNRSVVFILRLFPKLTWYNIHKILSTASDTGKCSGIWAMMVLFYFFNW